MCRVAVEFPSHRSQVPAGSRGSRQTWYQISKLYLELWNSCSWPAYLLTSHLFLGIRQTVRALPSANLQESSSSRTNSVLFSSVNIQTQIRCGSICSDTSLHRNQEWWLEGEINSRSANCFSNNWILLTRQSPRLYQQRRSDKCKACLRYIKFNPVH